MVQLLTVTHVSPACVRLDFDGSLRNNTDLRDETLYTVPGYTILEVRIPLQQVAEYNSGDPNPNGGSPSAVYLLLTAVGTSGSVSAGMTSTGLTTILEFAGSALTGTATKTLTIFDRSSVTFWDSPGLRTSEAFAEFAQEGRVRLTSEQPLNRSLVHMIGKLNDLMAGGFTAQLAADIAGPLEPSYVATFSPAGFANPIIPTPGIGETISFVGGRIPYHVDKLWGPSDGINTVFAASIQFHPFECELVMAGGRTGAADNGLVSPLRWYVPGGGYDRQIILYEAPPAGATIVAIYLPRKSLLQIGNEIIAYDELDRLTRTAVIYGRAQLMSTLETHLENDHVVDVWATSMVGKAEYNLLAFGASGKPLESIGLDRGSPRSDNPSLNDTELRRMIFHTSFNMRGVPGTTEEAIRYIFPDLWRYLIVGEDPRWPGCLTIWFSASSYIGDDSWITSPAVEPWETWLDHLLVPDGGTSNLLYETFLRDDGVDAEFYGDFLLETATDDPFGYAYPVLISGAPIQLLGEPAPVIPAPLVSGAVIDTTYRSYLNRPTALDKVLPIGCGVLLLDVDML